MEQKDPSNIHFELATAFVNQTGRHIFLTGKAGTGKTTFLRFIRENGYKKTAVAAPTGVAAINAGGVTLHSLLQIPFNQFVPTFSTGWDSGLLNRNTILRQLKMSSEKQELLRELELLIIDEASMVRADLLDAADTILRYVRQQPQQPFGGLQVLYIGDLYQLPPVVKEGEWNLLKEYYESPYFFDAQVMKETPLVYIELDKIYRQQDATFVNILNNIRNNTVTTADLDLLHQRFKPNFEAPADDFYITLTTHNFKAGQINQEQLQELNTLSHRFEAALEGDFNENSYPAEKLLELKKGSQVMFIKNDTNEPKRYFNGKIGVVDSIEKDEILIRFAGEKGLIKAEKETWENIRYAYNKDSDSVEEEKLGSFTQYPLRLAWAITIHKSQGLTFTRAIIDAGSAFAAGQVYVALSRLTDMEGLVLHTRIQQGAIFTDHRIERVLQYAASNETLQTLLQTESREYAGQLLLRVYDWQKMVREFADFHNDMDGRQIPEREKAMGLSHGFTQQVLQQQQTCEKFVPQLEDLLRQSQQQNEYGQLHDRVSKAAQYFEPLIKNMQQQIEQHIQEYRVKSKTKKYIRSLYGLRAVVQQKQKQLYQSQVLTQSLAGGGLPDYTAFKTKVIEKEKNDIAQTEQELAPKKKTVKGETKLMSLQMFQDGKSITEIALFRSLTNGTIEGHLTAFIETGEVTIEQLVKPEKMKQITAAMDELGEVASPALKEKLGADFSYGEIRAVQTYLKWQKAAGQ
jgi:hypothetical protein